MIGLVMNETLKMMKGKLMLITLVLLLASIAAIEVLSLYGDGSSVTKILPDYLTLGQMVLASLNQSIIIIVSIVYVALSIVEDHRGGMLKLGIIHGVERWKLMLSKWIGTALFLAILYLWIFMVHTVLYHLFVGVGVEAATIGRYLAMISLTVIPMLGFLSITMIAALWLNHTIGLIGIGFLSMLIFQMLQSVESIDFGYNIYSLINFPAQGALTSSMPWMVCGIYIGVGLLISIWRFNTMDIKY